MSKQPISDWPRRYRHISFWWATAGGLGLLKPGPGTWGSTAATMAAAGLITSGVSFSIFSGLILIVTLLSITAINRIEALSGIHDAPEIVMDEVAGQWLALVPLYFMPSSSLLHYLLAFALFRLFDIWKPWPISFLDKNTRGGFGVMVDDLAAGVLAGLLLFIIGAALL